MAFSIQYSYSYCYIIYSAGLLWLQLAKLRKTPMKLTVKLTFTSNHFIRNAQNMHEHIKFCAIPAVVVYLTFCQQVAHFFGEESLYNFFSLHIRQCNILSASYLLLASHLNTHIYLTHKWLMCCSKVAHESLTSCSWVAHRLLASHLHATCEHSLPCSWAVVYLLKNKSKAALAVNFKV